MNKTSLLFIKTKNLGDAVVLTAAASVVQPNAKVDVLCFADCAAVYDYTADVNRVYTLTRGARGLRSVLEHLSLICRLLIHPRYDALVHFSDDWRGAWLCRMLRPKLSVAARTPKRPDLWHRSFRHIVDGSFRQHAIDRDISLVSHAGVTVDLQRLRSKRLSAGLPIVKLETVTRPHVVVQAASRWAFKQLPEAVNASLVQKLIDRGYRVVLGGGPSDRRFNQSIASLVPADGQINDSANIGDFLRLVESASAVITIDSFALHVAEALQVPVVAIFGPSDERIWGPRARHSRVVELGKQFFCRPCRKDGCDGSKQSLCLKEISSEMIVSAFDDLMGVGCLGDTIDN